MDPLNAYLEIHAGAGGTESQDWAEMLRYLKWSDNKDFKYSIVSEHKGDEAGIKSTTIKIEGNYVWLVKKSGIHRLVESLHLTLEPEDIQVLQCVGFSCSWWRY